MIKILQDQENGKLLYARRDQVNNTYIKWYIPSVLFIIYE